MKMNKRGALRLGDMQGVVLVLVVAAIVLGLGLTVLASFQDALTVNTTAYNSTGDTITAIGTLGSTWYSIIVTVVASVIILGLVINAFR